MLIMKSISVNRLAHLFIKVINNMQHKAKHKIKSPVPLQSLKKKPISPIHLVSVMIDGDI